MGGADWLLELAVALMLWRRATAAIAAMLGAR